jgi:hypothetical protein
MPATCYLLPWLSPTKRGCADCTVSDALELKRPFIDTHFSELQQRYLSAVSAQPYSAGGPHNQGEDTSLSEGNQATQGQCGIEPAGGVSSHLREVSSIIESGTQVCPLWPSCGAFTGGRLDKGQLCLGNNQSQMFALGV